MNKRIIYPNDEGGVSIIIPSPAAKREVNVAPEGEEPVFVVESDDDFLAWVASKDVPTGKPYKIIGDDEVPTDRTFRNAWEYQE
jgi:hypothetical protein